MDASIDFIELRHISKNYHEPASETSALKDVSFTVVEGEFLAIVGPSGCGKSTLLSIISSLLPPSGGQITIKGRLLDWDAQKRDSPAAKRTEDSPAVVIGYMPQKDHLFEWRSILQNVYLGLEIQKKNTEENRNFAENLLDRYGLRDFKNHRPNQLSGGMRQRAALIRTLAVKPDVLLLDEPFSALDYQTRLQVADAIYAIIKQEKKTAVLVTHDISEAVSMSDRVVVMSARPATVKRIFDVRFAAPGRTPMKAREQPEFKDYFNDIWKELDFHDDGELQP